MNFNDECALDYVVGDTSWSNNKTLERIVECIREVEFGRIEDLFWITEFTQLVEFYDKLWWDYLDYYEFEMALEDEFDYEFCETSIEDYLTVGDLIGILQ